MATRVAVLNRTMQPISRARASCLGLRAYGCDSMCGALWRTVISHVTRPTAVVAPAFSGSFFAAVSGLRRLVEMRRRFRYMRPLDDLPPILRRRSTRLRQEEAGGYLARCKEATCKVRSPHDSQVNAVASFGRAATSGGRGDQRRQHRQQKRRSGSRRTVPLACGMLRPPGAGVSRRPLQGEGSRHTLFHCSASAIASS